MASSVTELSGELARAAEGLKRLGRRFALVGGLGISIRGEVRFTRDIDATNPTLDLDATRARLRLIRERGFHRGHDLEARLAALLASL